LFGEHIVARSAANGREDGVKFAGAFVEEVAEVGGGSVGGGDGEVHGGWCDCSGSFAGSEMRRLVETATGLPIRGCVVKERRARRAVPLRELRLWRRPVRAGAAWGLVGAAFGVVDWGVLVEDVDQAAACLGDAGVFAADDFAGLHGVAVDVAAGVVIGADGGAF
jgi:hypothetical protein